MPPADLAGLGAASPRSVWRGATTGGCSLRLGAGVVGLGGAGSAGGGAAGSTTRADVCGWRADHGRVTNSVAATSATRTITAIASERREAASGTDDASTSRTVESAIAGVWTNGVEVGPATVASGTSVGNGLWVSTMAAAPGSGGGSVASMTVTAGAGESNG